MHASLSHIALNEALANRMGPYMPPKSVHLRIRQTSGSASAVGAGMGEREGEGTAFGPHRMGICNVAG